MGHANGLVPMPRGHWLLFQKSLLVEQGFVLTLKVIQKHLGTPWGFELRARVKAV